MGATVTYTFSPGAQVESAKFNQNFTDLCDYIDGNVPLLDGSRAFTGVPSGPSTDPSSDNQYARKAYVDGKVGLLSSLVKNSVSNTTGTSPTDLGINMPTWTMPTIANGRSVRIALYWPASELISQGGGSPAEGGDPAELWIRVNAVNKQRYLMPISTSAFFPTENTGGVLEWLLTSNSTYPAGTTMTCKVYGAHTNPGAIRLVGDSTDQSILYYAHII